MYVILFYFENSYYHAHLTNKETECKVSSNRLTLSLDGWIVGLMALQERVTVWGRKQSAQQGRGNTWTTASRRGREQQNSTAWSTKKKSLVCEGGSGTEQQRRANLRSAKARRSRGMLLRTRSPAAKLQCDWLAQWRRTQTPVHGGPNECRQSEVQISS